MKREEMNGKQRKRNVRLENRTRGRVFAAFSCALLVLCWLVPAAMAQETTAGIQGVVKDSTGAVVS
jgi:hypothetical protein